jgi:hypothetical protein
MIAFKQFDLSNYSDVVQHSDKILARLTQGDMPCDGKWPPERVQVFKDWIAGGKQP